MPPAKIPDTLVVQTIRTLVQKSFFPNLKRLENLWRPKPKIERSAKRSPISPSKRNFIIDPILVAYQDNEDFRVQQVQKMRESLLILPLSLRESVVDEILRHIEFKMTFECEMNVIRSLINVSESKISDFFFGMFVLLEVLQETNISTINFLDGIWRSLIDCKQVFKNFYVEDKLCEALPHFANVQSLNLSYISDDKICCLISRNIPRLQELILDHSTLLTDQGLKFLCGVHQRTCEECQTLVVDTTTPPGNLQLKHLSIEDCGSITETIIWTLLLNLSELRVLNYSSATTSVPKIIAAQCVDVLNEKELETIRFKLTSFCQNIRMDFNPEASKYVFGICPNITVLDIVVSNSDLATFTALKHLKSATLCLEDYIGLGLRNFLEKMGKELQELSISCWPTGSTFMEYGNTGCHNYNIGMLLASRFCSQIKLKRLSFAGIGMVANDLRQDVEIGGNKNPKGLSNLESLIFLTEQKSQGESNSNDPTCQKKILLEFLQGCQNIQIISLEGNFSEVFSDKFIDELLGRNSLNNLRIFDVQGRGREEYDLPLMTEVSAYRLLHSCNKLSQIRILNWKISFAELNRIGDLIRENGWDVILRD